MKYNIDQIAHNGPFSRCSTIEKNFNITVRDICTTKRDVEIQMIDQKTEKKDKQYQ